VVILTRIQHHTIFYAYTSLLDKYCENETCKYEYRNFKNDTLLWDSVFPFGYKGLSTSDSLTIWCTATWQAIIYLRPFYQVCITL